MKTFHMAALSLFATLLLASCGEPAGHREEGAHSHADEHNEGGHDDAAGQGDHAKHADADEHGHADEHGGGDSDDEHGDEEGRFDLAPEVASANGVEITVAAPRSLERSRRLTGRIGMASDRMAELRPRFAGTVRSATGRIGDKVAAGSNLAVVERSETLAQFRLDSPLAGTILARKAVVGGVAGTDDVLYVVADLSEVWADFDVYGSDTAIVRAGETVTVRDDSGRPDVDAKISYVSPLRDVHTQTTLARAVLPNANARWAPGSFITGIIRLEEEAAAVAVPVTSLQQWRDRDAVFVPSGSTWQVRPVVVGRRGERWVEILEGLTDGTAVAAGNTFLLRAELEKAGLAHEH